ncbi:hypothetical protein GCM10027567_02490 [Spongiibacter taiwanensis]
MKGSAEVVDALATQMLYNPAYYQGPVAAHARGQKKISRRQMQGFCPRQESSSEATQYHSRH